MIKIFKLLLYINIYYLFLYLLINLNMIISKLKKSYQ